MKEPMQPIIITIITKIQKHSNVSKIFFIYFLFSCSQPTTFSSYMRYKATCSDKFHTSGAKHYTYMHTQIHTCTVPVF